MLYKLCVNKSPSTTAVSSTQTKPQNLCPCFMGVLCIQYYVWNHWQKIFHEVFFVHVSYMKLSWWLHQIETFSALVAFCAGNSPVTSKFPAQRPVTRSFDIFFDLRLNKRLSKNREAGDMRHHRAHYDVIVIMGNVGVCHVTSTLSYIYSCGGVLPLGVA